LQGKLKGTFSFFFIYLFFGANSGETIRIVPTAPESGRLTGAKVPDSHGVLVGPVDVEGGAAGHLGAGPALVCAGEFDELKATHVGWLKQSAWQAARSVFGCCAVMSEVDASLSGWIQLLKHW
jgi:hypothetical protein